MKRANSGPGFLARVCVAVARGKDRVVRREIKAALRAGTRIDDLREAILQTYLFAGFPRAINGLWALDMAARLEPGRPAGPAPRASVGERLCRAIYGGEYEAMMARMRRLSPELALWILEEGYGKVLSRPHFGPRVRELLVVPTLAAMETWRQLSGHVRGARRVGASAGELRRVLKAVRDLLPSRVYGRAWKMVTRSFRGERLFGRSRSHDSLRKTDRRARRGYGEDPEPFS
ncbi:MAG: carboxymuconolactone decarboxylase family protein [Planctomycetes bacterium]|nr:carboxymuconolactone decarboxylase family protein [Planctomycetota bacterium]